MIQCIINIFTDFPAVRASEVNSGRHCHPGNGWSNRVARTRACLCGAALRSGRDWQFRTRNLTYRYRHEAERNLEKRRVAIMKSKSFQKLQRRGPGLALHSSNHCMARAANFAWR